MVIKSIVTKLQTIEYYMCIKILVDLQFHLFEDGMISMYLQNCFAYNHAENLESMIKFYYI